MPATVESLQNEVNKLRQDSNMNYHRSKAQIHALHKRMSALEELLAEKIPAMEKQQQDSNEHQDTWTPFVLEPHTTHLKTSNKGHTVTMKDEASFETIPGGAEWSDGYHSFRVKLDKGKNMFIGVVGCAKLLESQWAQFVGQTNSIGLRTSDGTVYADGKETCLGDHAIAKQGDVIGCRVKISKQPGESNIKFYKNGVALARSMPIEIEGALRPAVTLTNSHDQITLLFSV